MKFRVTLEDSFTYKLAAIANKVSQDSLIAAQDAVKRLARRTETKAREMASERLNTTRQRYEDSLNFTQTGDHIWVLKLEEDASHLEEGYPSFNMIDGMLKSESDVSAGPRAGKPWVRIGKDGHRYAAVMFEHKQAPAKGNHPQHDVPVQRMSATPTTRGSLAQDLMQLKQMFGDNGLMKMPSGAPVEGKVYSITKDKEGPRWNYADVFGNTQSMMQPGGMEDRAISPLMSGLTKIQTKVGKTTKTQYLTWRMVSDKSPGKWQHPGFHGAHIFPDLERWAIQELTRDLHEIFQEGKF